MNRPLPWAEFISATYDDVYYLPLDPTWSFRYFEPASFPDISNAWSKTLGLMRDGLCASKIDLFVHWPFSANFIPTHFGNIPKHSDLKIAIEFLKEEMLRLKSIFHNFSFNSVRIGIGRNPEIVDPTDLEAVLSCLHSCFAFSTKNPVYVECSSEAFTESIRRVLLRQGLTGIRMWSQGYGGRLNISDQGIEVTMPFMWDERCFNEYELIKELKNLFNMGPNSLPVYFSNSLNEMQYKRSIAIADSLAEEFEYKISYGDWEDLSLYPLDTMFGLRWRNFRNSFLGLGSGTLSHAFGGAWYWQPYFEGVAFQERPIVMMDSNIEEEMRGYMIEFLSRSQRVSRTAFSELFKRDVMDVPALVKPLTELRLLGFLQINNQFISWVGTDSVERTIQLKRLYSSQIIRAILKSEPAVFQEFSKKYTKGLVNLRETILENKQRRDGCRVYYDPRRPLKGVKH
jgi:hypothetical protein